MSVSVSCFDGHEEVFILLNVEGFNVMLIKNSYENQCLRNLVEANLMALE